MPSLSCRLILAFAAIVLLPAVLFADDYFQVTTLAPDLLMLSTDQGSYSNNSLVFTGEDGVLLVDTHHATDVEALRDFVDGLGLGTPKYIINTHRHVEHIGGNALFGPDPIVVAHRLFPEKLRSGSFLFNEYPPEAFPDITLDDSLEIIFNGEVIRLVNIGGSHDDNEIMVYFTHHGIAHVSSVVNGFNFPSVDGDGDVLQFEAMTRRLMTLLPEDTRLISGHHGKAKGFDFVGTWEMLPAYADMMSSSIEIVRQGLAAGKTTEQMQETGILDEYEDYAGSYVGTDDWIEYVVDALTIPRETRSDICKPIFDAWKKDGAAVAVESYRQLLQTQEKKFDFNEFVLMSIGGKLFIRGLYADSVEFLEGSLDLYPDSEYGYYTHYLAARSHEQLAQLDLAIDHCQESMRINPDFAQASELMDELSARRDDPQETETPPPIEVSKISEGFYHLRCNGDAGVVASIGDDGVLLVDTGYAATAAELKNKVSELGRGPVEIIVNTHGDADHTGGNAVIGEKAVIIAHPEVGRRMSTFFSLPAIETAGLPNLTLEGNATIHFNGDLIRFLPLPGGHTDGDVIVHFTKNRVACVGDLVLLGTFPNADPARGGDARRLIEVLTWIHENLPADTTLVSAHGGVFSMAELQTYIEMVASTVAAVATEKEAGRSLAQIIEVNPLAPWSDWESPGNGLSFENWTTEIYASLAGAGPQSICAPMTEMLEREGVQAAVARYRHLKSTEAENWRFAEFELNMLGYQLLARNRIDEAVAVFELNVEAYPEASNTYDSLGEAYMLAGRSAEAIANYERSLELNPDNTNAVAMLDRLREE